MSNHPKYGNIVKATADRLGQVPNGTGNQLQMSNDIQKRVNALKVNRLMKAAREREQFDRNTFGQYKDDFLGVKFRTPNLSMRENEGVLRYAAMNILGNSAQEDPMEILVDKVVVLCVILSNPDASSHLDIALIMRTMDDIFSKYHDDSVYDMRYRLGMLASRLIGLNRAFKGRADATDAAAAAAAAAAGPVAPSLRNASMMAYDAYKAAKLRGATDKEASRQARAAYHDFMTRGSAVDSNHYASMVAYDAFSDVKARGASDEEASREARAAYEHVMSRAPAAPVDSSTHEAYMNAHTAYEEAKLMGESDEEASRQEQDIFDVWYTRAHAWDPPTHDASMAANQSSPSNMEEVDGGFYKKNYRRSIKKNSRKLRSRR